ncbi:MAG: DUF2911 domain-containing protein, partial [Flavobacteriales bacterium]|nr:DUF2911 domain-containing protein [Flavobacteriales bacterium]
MKSLFSTIAMALMLFSSVSQAQYLPRPSQWTELKQVIGVTSIDIKYSRPNVKGREIWGELVKYGEVWRLGANESTIFTTQFDIEINGEKLAKGSYSVYAFPGEKEWKLSFNTYTKGWGGVDYDA